MTTPSIQDFEIYSHYVDNKVKKAEIARMYKVHPRTVGRAIERVEEYQNSIGQVTQNGKTWEPEPIQTHIEFDALDDSTTDDKINDEEVRYMFILTEEKSLQITKISSDKVDTVNVLTDHRMYTEFLDHLKNNDFNNESLEYVYNNANLKQIIIHSNGRVRIDESKGTVFFINDDNEKISVPVMLSDHIYDAVINNDTSKLNKLSRFTEQLMNNCSYKTIQNAYVFMIKNNIDIDEQGNIIAFKSVAKNYRDHRTGDFDNSVGKIVKMKRSEVDDNADNECSRGLHIGAYEYALHYGKRYGRRIVKVKANPADIVAATADCDYMKMRVCKYEVLEDITPNG